MFHVTIVFVSGVCKVRRMSTLVGGHKPAHSHSQVLGDSESEAFFFRSYVRVLDQLAPQNFRSYLSDTMG